MLSNKLGGVALAPADRAILERRVRRLVDEALVDEHRATPIGSHSPALTEVLHFLRRNPDPDLPRYLLVRSGTPPVWRVARRRSPPGTPPVTVDAVEHRSRASAEHAVFLRRLADYGLRG